MSGSPTFNYIGKGLGGIRNHIAGHRKSNANYQLTPIGRGKIEESQVISPARVRVMSALLDAAPCTVREAAQVARMSPEKTKQVIDALLSDGWAMKTGAMDI